MHRYFEQDPRKAQYKYWLYQAGKLLACVMEVDVRTKSVVRSFISCEVVTKDSKPVRAYFHRSKIMQNAVMRGSVAMDLKRRIKATVREAEGLRLDQQSPKWKQVIAAGKAL